MEPDKITFFESMEKGTTDKKMVMKCPCGSVDTDPLPGSAKEWDYKTIKNVAKKNNYPRRMFEGTKGIGKLRCSSSHLFEVCVTKVDGDILLFYRFLGKAK